MKNLSIVNVSDYQLETRRVMANETIGKRILKIYTVIEFNHASC